MATLTLCVNMIYVNVGIVPELSAYKQVSVFVDQSSSLRFGL